MNTRLFQIAISPGKKIKQGPRLKSWGSMGMFELSWSEMTWGQDLQGERELAMGISEGTVIQKDGPMAGRSLGCPGLHGRLD